MNSFFFNAGVNSANAAVKAADVSIAAAKVAKHVATKGADATVTGAKATREAGSSFIDGFRFALGANKALVVKPNVLSAK